MTERGRERGEKKEGDGGYSMNREETQGERRGRHRGRTGKRQSGRQKERCTGRVKRGDKGKRT